MWKCQECDRLFKSVAAAERASENGCPGCGGSDIDLAPDPDRKPRRKVCQRTAAERVLVVQAYTRGHDAGQANVLEGGNPYPPGSELGAEYERGRADGLAALTAWRNDRTANGLAVNG